jgi:GxxExxY protein
MEEDRITSRIIACGLNVHKELGPGLLESAYQNALASEFQNDGIAFISQMTFPLIYNGKWTNKGYRVDFLVEGKVVVEVKAVQAIPLIDHAQVNTYLRLLKCRVG